MGTILVLILSSSAFFYFLFLINSVEYSPIVGNPIIYAIKFLSIDSVLSNHRKLLCTHLSSSCIQLFTSGLLLKCIISGKFSIPKRYNPITHCSSSNVIIGYFGLVLFYKYFSSKSSINLSFMVMSWSTYFNFSVVSSKVTQIDMLSRISSVSMGYFFYKFTDFASIFIKSMQSL